jgi:hypothetical protein
MPASVVSARVATLVASAALLAGGRGVKFWSAWFALESRDVVEQ